jgi:hypothetical protein
MGTSLNAVRHDDNNAKGIHPLLANNQNFRKLISLEEIGGGVKEDRTYMYS